MFILFGGLDLDIELFFEQVADHGTVMVAAISPVDVRWCCLKDCFCSDALDVASNSDYLRFGELEKLTKSIKLFIRAG